MIRRLPSLILLAHLLLLQVLVPFAHFHGEAQARPHIHLDGLPFLGQHGPTTDEHPSSDHDDDAVYLPDDPALPLDGPRVALIDHVCWLVVLPDREWLTLEHLESISLPPPFDEPPGPPVYLRTHKLLI